MRLLLDTHVLLWVMADNPALSSEARTTIERADVVFASAVSVWEVSIKIGLGKLQVDPERFMEGLRASGFQPLDITWNHAETVRTLPLLHRDPFDRLLVAQAVNEPLKLMTADKVLARYSDLVLTI